MIKKIIYITILLAMLSSNRAYAVDNMLTLFVDGAPPIPWFMFTVEYARNISQDTAVAGRIGYATNVTPTGFLNYGEISKNASGLAIGGDYRAYVANHSNYAVFLGPAIDLYAMTFSLTGFMATTQKPYPNFLYSDFYIEPKVKLGILYITDAGMIFGIDCSLGYVFTTETSITFSYAGGIRLGWGW